MFDMDGVLIDSHNVWFDIFNSALVHFGFNKISRDEFDKNVWAINFSETVNKYFPGKTIEELREYYYKNFDNFVVKIKKMENLNPILEDIKKKGLKIAVVSNTQSNIVRAILRRIGVEDYFDIIVGGDMVQKGKPDPEIVFVACDKLKVKPEEAILVGDTIYDKQAAESAGCGFVGYRMGNEKRINSLRDVLNFI